MEKVRLDDQLAAAFGMGETAEVESVEETIAPIVGVKSGKSAFGKLSQDAPKPSKPAPVKQKVVGDKSVKTEKKTDYSMPLISVLQGYGLNEGDFEKWVASKTKVRRGGYNSKQSMEILKFLAQFKYATASILKNIHGVTERAAHAQMTRLIAKGLVRRLSLPGVKSLFTLTTNGMELAGYDFGVINENGVNATSLQPTLGAAWYASQSIKKGLTVVSEREILSSKEKMSVEFFGKEKKNDEDISKNKFVLAKAKTAWSSWDKTPETNPALQPGGEWLFALWNTKERSGASLYHVPDLVVLNLDGQGHNVAIEVERTKKQVEDYVKIANSYQMNKDVIGQVVWHVATDGIGANITEGFTRVGAKKEDFAVRRFKVKNANGETVTHRGDFTKI